MARKKAIWFMWLKRYLGISSYPFGRQSRTCVGPEVFPETTEFYDNGGVETAMATWLPCLWGVVVYSGGFVIHLFVVNISMDLQAFESIDCFGENLSKMEGEKFLKMMQNHNAMAEIFGDKLLPFWEAKQDLHHRFYDNGGVETAMATWLPWFGFSVCLLQSLYKNGMFLFGSSDFSLAWMVGPRSFPSNNALLTLAGAGLLWMGWAGFNGGDPYTANIDSSMALAVSGLGFHSLRSGSSNGFGMGFQFSRAGSLNIFGWVSSPHGMEAQMVLGGFPVLTGWKPKYCWVGLPVLTGWKPKCLLNMRAKHEAQPAYPSLPAYLLVPLGKGGRDDDSCRGGVVNGGLWWPEGFFNLIRNTLKKINDYQFANPRTSQTFIGVAMNLARMAQCMYRYGDARGVGILETKDMGWAASPALVSWATSPALPVTWDWAFDPFKGNGPGLSTGLGLSIYFQAGLQPMNPFGLTKKMNSEYEDFSSTTNGLPVIAVVYRSGRNCRQKLAVTLQGLLLLRLSSPLSFPEMKAEFPGIWVAYGGDAWPESGC
uniref:Ammonium transporter AmtB-like domain-containing protein n=1 Tax=Salix viminalis TaxID=40686 RepID=A0A6N2KRN5_SALVM